MVTKYLPQIEALETQLASDAGLSVFPAPPLTEEQHQRLLFGRFFVALDKPLVGLPSIYKQVPSQTAFVCNLRVIADMGRDRYLYITRSFS